MPDLSLLDRAILLTHVLAGVTALAMAPLALLARKGGTAHRRWGTLYFWAMFAIFASSLAVMTYRPNAFLLCIAVLAFYSAFSGYRVLHRKRPQRGRGAAWLDWAGASLALGSGAGGAAWGVGSLVGWLPLSVGTAFSGLGIAFGALLGKQALEDLRGFRRPAEDRNWWWYVHMDRMLTSSIAALTAFLVQNVGRHLAPEVGWLVWVLPGLLGGPAIGYWVSSYRRRFAQAQQRRSGRASAAGSAGPGESDLNAGGEEEQSMHTSTASRAPSMPAADRGRGALSRLRGW